MALIVLFSVRVSRASNLRNRPQLVESGSLKGTLARISLGALRQSEHV